MPDMNIERLNQQFSFCEGNNRLQFEIGRGGIPVVSIQNDQASAMISLQGAHLLEWQPVGEEPVIWLSEDARFAPGKSVRGGIPVCWPWFGAHSQHNNWPAHGFARTVLWTVDSAESLPTGETSITFQLETDKLDEQYQLMWPQMTTAKYTLTIGQELTLALTTVNHGDSPIIVNQALHTYFFVGDITQTVVSGLENKSYLDKTDDFNRKVQEGPVLIDKEVDRIYLQTTEDVTIDNKKRKIVISKQGSHSTVVWNPGQYVAEKMGDLGKDGYLAMLCVESANAAEDAVEIVAGDRHTLTVNYRIES